MCVCVTLCERDRKKKYRESKKPRYKEPVYAALDCPSHWTLRGPFRMAVNHGPALPARRLEAQDKPTAELHPVCPSSTAHSSVTMGHSGHFTLQEDPVCQSSSNHPVCE